ncbi:hypothetical protein LguiA_016168 [Lonicera macranthoides]
MSVATSLLLHTSTNGAEKLLIENKMEGEDLRTVECLRGRLLAERMASKVAKEYADQMSNKLIELENKLRAEMKSRNKAEKRMNLLMKKLGFLNISFASDESEHSFEKGEVSSVSSTASSYTKQQDKKSNAQIANSRKCDIGELMKNTESPIVPRSSDRTSQTTASSQSSNEGNLDCIDVDSHRNSGKAKRPFSSFQLQWCKCGTVLSVEDTEIEGEDDQRLDEWC